MQLSSETQPGVQRELFSSRDSIVDVFLAEKKDTNNVTKMPIFMLNCGMFVWPNNVDFTVFFDFERVTHTHKI